MLTKQRRTGAMAVELLFVFPLLLAVLLGTVEFSLWLAAQQQVALASRGGARVAATGGSAGDVGQAVRLVLGDARFEQAQLRADLTDANGDALASGQPVSVLVQLPVTAVVPDLLAFIGVSIRGQVIVSQTVMR